MLMENVIFNFEGYLGSCHFDPELKTFHGKILGIKDLVTYEALNSDDLHEEFIASVKDYLETCSELNREPQRMVLH
jgi:predicted HicB family RNase H-like nuclease